MIMTNYQVLHIIIYIGTLGYIESIADTECYSQIRGGREGEEERQKGERERKMGRKGRRVGRKEWRQREEERGGGGRETEGGRERGKGKERGEGRKGDREKEKERK